MDAYELQLYTTFLISSFLVILLLFYAGWALMRTNRKVIAEKISGYHHEMQLLEQERLRISRDLHDDLAPRLAISKNLLLTLEGSSDWERKVLKSVVENLSEANSNIGIVAGNLRASRLLKKGLQVALEELCEQVRCNNELMVRFHYQVATTLSDSMKIQVYRIIQEIVGNAVKHAKASYVEVSLKEKRSMLLVQIADNGVGFVPGLHEHEGFGLENIRYRVEMLKGKISLHSHIGGGTRYQMTLFL